MCEDVTEELNKAAVGGGRTKRVKIHRKNLKRDNERRNYMKKYKKAKTK